MFNIDSSSVTAVIALAAIASPVITTALNIGLQVWLKKLDLQEQSRRDIALHNREIYERYLRYAGKCAKGSSEDDYATYGESFALAYAYSPDSVRTYMRLLDDEIIANDKELINIHLPDVSSMIADIINGPHDNVKNNHD